MKYIDSHSHLFEKKFKDDLSDVLSRMSEHEVGTIVVGVSLETSKQCIELAEKHSQVLGAIIGVHPTDTDEKFLAEDYAPLVNEYVLGIGECGFDYYRGNKEDVYVHQREVFEAQVAFAIEYDLPLMLHVRPSEGSTDAHDDTLEVLRLYQQEYGAKVRGNVHFFTGSKDVARAYLELGFTISFPGVVTFVPELAEVVRDVPLDMMLAETDAPYAAPVPHRGKRNEPIFVLDTIRHIAQVRGEDFETVAATITENTQRLFRAL